MKKALSLFIYSLLCITTLWGQNPQKMSYQAVIRDVSGKLITNQSVGIQVSILQGSATGTEVYKELHNPNPKTNANGLVSIEIGGGIALSGTFANINWSTGPYFIKTEIDPTGGTTYTINGASQVLSVPYALYAKTAESINGGITETDPVFNASVAKSIKSSDTIRWGNKLSSYAETDPLFNASVAKGIKTTDTTRWGKKLSSYTETDPLFSASVAKKINAADTVKWNAKSNFSGSYTNLTSKPTFTDSISKYSVLLKGDQTIAGNKTYSSDVTINGITVGLGKNSDFFSSYSTAVGNGALYSNTFGYFNTAIGTGTLYSNTTGNENTANGYQALYSNTTGYNNIANGYQALNSNITGFGNTANGSQALIFTTGNYNTAIGNNALFYNVTGSNNTALGALTGSPSGTGNLSNTTTLGYSATVTTSNSIMLGNSSVTSIGGYAAWSNFSDGRFKTNVQTNVPGLSFILKLRPVTFTWDLHKLDAFRGINDSAMLKSPAIENARLAREKKTYTGFIAQEVEQAAANCGFDFSGIVKPENDKTPYNLSYAEFVVPLVKAMQEQQKTITEIGKQNAELKSELLVLKAAVDALLKK